MGKFGLKPEKVINMGFEVRTTLLKCNLRLKQNKGTLKNGHVYTVPGILQ
jgi:hypothetical protein